MRRILVIISQVEVRSPGWLIYGESAVLVKAIFLKVVFTMFAMCRLVAKRKQIMLFVRWSVGTVICLLKDIEAIQRRPLKRQHLVKAKKMRRLLLGGGELL